MLYTCGEDAGPRKAQVVVVMVVGGPNQVVYLIANQFITTKNSLCCGIRYVLQFFEHWIFIFFITILSFLCVIIQILEELCGW